MQPFVVSGELDIRLKVKLQLKILIPPSPWSTGAWVKSIPVDPTQVGKGQGGQRGLKEIFLCYWPRQQAKA